MGKEEILILYHVNSDSGIKLKNIICSKDQYKEFSNEIKNNPNKTFGCSYFVTPLEIPHQTDHGKFTIVQSESASDLQPE